MADAATRGGVHPRLLGLSRRSGSAYPVRPRVRRHGARSRALAVVETQALSVFVFAGSAQVSAAGLFAAGAAGLEIVLTTFLLNVRHVLYGALARPRARR